MLITRRSDYALRICRVLKDGRIHNVTEICRAEQVPKAFAYKILREMEHKDIVRSERGNQGGYYINIPLEELTLYDVVRELDDDMSINHCMRGDCSRNTEEEPCKVHMEIARIQSILEKELRQKSIAEILG